MNSTKNAITTRLVLAAAVSVLVAGSASAGSFAVYPSYWDTKDAGSVGGLGVNFTVPIYKFLDFEARASYYEELTNEPLDDFFSGNSPIQDGIRALPLEVGVRFNFLQDNKVWHPWAGIGGAYYMLDTDAGNIDDEFGYYATFGSTFGYGQGIDFYADLSYRFAEGSVTGELNGGPVANVGIVWKW